MNSAGTGPADDRRLLERIRRGDTEGAAELFERYGPALLRFSDRLLADRSTAEEVTQEVFVKVISRAHQYDGRAEVASWLFAIAANACRDREKREAVRAALALLSPEQREALVLARYHGLPYAEIASVLGISVGAVKTRIFRAVETLKLRFAEGEATWNAAN